MLARGLKWLAAGSMAALVLALGSTTATPAMAEQPLEGPSSPVAVHEVQARYLLANAVKGDGSLPIVSADMLVAGAAAAEEAARGNQALVESGSALELPTPTVIASFVVDGCAYAIEPEGDTVALVAVDPTMEGHLELSAEVRDALGRAYPVARIAAQAFAGSRLSSVAMPSSLAQVEAGAFDGAEDLAEIEVIESDGTRSPLDASNLATSNGSIEALPVASLQEAASYAAGVQVYVYAGSDEAYYIDSSGAFKAWGYRNKWVLTTAAYYEYRFEDGIFYYTNKYRTLSIYNDKNRTGFNYLRVGTSLEEAFADVEPSTEFTPIDSRLYFIMYNTTPFLYFDVSNPGSTGASGTPIKPYSPLPSKAKPTKAGYAFQGYYSEPNGAGTQYYDANCQPVRIFDSPVSMTLYSYWTELPYYTVTLDKRGGSGGPASVSVQSGSTMPALQVPVLDGWEFAGYTDDFTNIPYLFSKADGTPTTRTITTTRSLKANWVRMVSFDANGGTSGSLKELLVGKDRDMGLACGQVDSAAPDYPIRSLFPISLKPDEQWAPTRVGYSFQGFYDTPEATGGTCYVDAEGALKVKAPYAVDMPTTLYARWAPNAYAIEFDAQGGPEVEAIEAVYDADVTLPQPGPRAGFRFVAWNTQADGSGTVCLAGVVLPAPNLAMAGKVTLYAQWAAALSVDVPLRVVVSLDLFGGEEQAEAEGTAGWIESRCGLPLKVASVSFEPKPEAIDLFGANQGRVILQALAGEGTSWVGDGATFSFVLDAQGSAAVEENAVKLAPLTMHAYGERVPICYRFGVPADVLGAIDHERFEKVTTPVCAVSFAVALA